MEGGSFDKSVGGVDPSVGEALAVVGWGAAVGDKVAAIDITQVDNDSGQFVGIGTKSTAGCFPTVLLGQLLHVGTHLMG